ncbi:hypothetical protein BDK51DRAFT_38421 [Blyttiomyces helicus]|uniref:Uncharacterized protein n=1 Tax=Blyttiomyces helicus TaxID=388810 RepID=A0A4P9WIS5_9FUNG|nr:hypothetical protein BDK51DRAFT_38421 [Blyttiomyces helicus]|eukprot:RKO91803.1 hypothetical protein BDK51DRAFT_38421 [Blyttiomyces helicus]
MTKISDSQADTDAQLLVPLQPLEPNFSATTHYVSRPQDAARVYACIRRTQPQMAYFTMEGTAGGALFHTLLCSFFKCFLSEEVAPLMLSYLAGMYFCLQGNKKRGKGREGEEMLANGRNTFWEAYLHRLLLGNLHLVEPCAILTELLGVARLPAIFCLLLILPLMFRICPPPARPPLRGLHVCIPVAMSFLSPSAVLIARSLPQLAARSAKAAGQAGLQGNCLARKDGGSAYGAAASIIFASGVPAGEWYQSTGSCGGGQKAELRPGPAG